MNHDISTQENENKPKTRRRSTSKQRRASKINGSRSKGPVTESGKKISRCNSLKHGLTGEGIVLIEAEEQIVEERLDEWTKALNVQNPIQTYLVQRAVIASVRLDTIDQFQEARRIKRLAKIEAKFDPPLDPYLIERTQAAHLVRGHTQKLLENPLGCDRLVELWADLGEALLDNRQTGWTDQQRYGVLALLEKPHSEPDSPCSFHRQLQTDSQVSLDANPDAVHVCRQYLRGELTDLVPLARIEANDSTGSKALLKLIRMIVNQINAIEAQADEIEEVNGLARDEAIERSAVDLSKTGVLLQRYQNQATNELTKMLREVRREQALEAQNSQKPNEPGAAIPSPKPAAAPKTCAESVRQNQARVIAEATSKSSVMNTLLARLQADKARDAEIERENRPLEPARS